MKRFQTRYLILICVLAISSLIILRIQNRQPVEKTNTDITKIPLKIGEWYGEEIQVDKSVKDILETESVIMRQYKRQDNLIWLAIVYYKDSRVAFHLPESCYVGQGAYIIKRDNERLTDLESNSFLANKLILKGNKGNQIILYYFATNGIITPSYPALRWQMVLNKLRAKSNSAGLVRFSALIKGNEQETLNLLKDFIKQAAWEISKVLF